MPYTDLDSLLPGGSATTGDSVPADYFEGITTNFELVDPWGQWTVHTPTITQSVAVSNTVTYSRWMRIGRLVIWSCAVAITSAGTGNNIITFTLPVTAAHAPGALLVVGSGHINDASVAQYNVNAALNSSTLLGFLRSDNTYSNWFGIDPNMALASGDVMDFTVMYEAAADA
jgi:hypothetical protein